MQIHTLLIANRGEIALRIQRTAKEMGIRTVAVYVETDADSPFVVGADIAIPLRGAGTSETYLDAEQLLAACEISGANAVHPGYGFLSENASFAQSVIDAGLIWVGPSPEVISAMGDKLSSKKLMQEAGVPVLSSIEVDEAGAYIKKAAELGYPILVKASAGGGGKGMRVVDSETELESAIQSAKREAGAAFGDDTIFLEKWVTSSRHVEVQLLGDQHGHVLHAFERECSIQRRHQKVIEEAPSPSISEELRERMCSAAVKAAKSIGYYSTGTMEFLVSGDDFYFLEVNTRLQVEHPVTEEITGLDLVREQLRVAEGEPLGYEQEEISRSGYSIEARLYAEDPLNDFLPSPGRIDVWEPSIFNGVRFDTGICEGSEIGIDFDPMIAKVIVHAPTRREATAKLVRVLETTRLQGLKTNQQFLINALNTSDFLAGDTTTDFIERVNPNRELVLQDKAIDRAAIAVVLAARANRQANAKVLSTIPRGWTNTKMPLDLTKLNLGERELEVGYKLLRSGTLEFFVGESRYLVQCRAAELSSVDMIVENMRFMYQLKQVGQKWYVMGADGAIELIEQERFPSSVEEVQEGDLTAPMPSIVQQIKAKEGETVSKGQAILTVESMKMELQIKAPRDGVVSEIKVKTGRHVDHGQVVASLEEIEVEPAV